jgi:hypothetical protein
MWPVSRSANYAAEIAASESRILVREHIGLDVAEPGNALLAAPCCPCVILADNAPPRR